MAGEFVCKILCSLLALTFLLSISSVSCIPMPSGVENSGLREGRQYGGYPGGGYGGYNPQGYGSFGGYPSFASANAQASASANSNTFGK